MIYLDSSVALAELLVEKKRPSAAFWTGSLVSSKLLEYEVVVRHNAQRRPPGAIKTARLLLSKVHLIELDPPPLARALQPFPVSVRTLDAIHLATMTFLQVRGISIELATYDTRLAQAATAMGFALVPL